MGKTKIGKGAVLCTGIAFILIIIAFTTPNWLETDGELKEAKFVKIGLWQVCFQGVQDTYQRFFDDKKFYGCWWVFEEGYYRIHEIKLPHFFVVTQFFFTLCMTLLLIGGSLATLYTCCSRHHDKYQLLLWTTGANLLLAGVCGTIAVIIFASQGDGHDWMPNWEHNEISWSFTVAVLGCVAVKFSAILFFLEARTYRNMMQRTIDEMRRVNTTI